MSLVPHTPEYLPSVHRPFLTEGYAFTVVWAPLTKKKSKRKPKVSKLFVKTKPELHISLFRTKNSTLNHRKVSINVSTLVF